MNLFTLLFPDNNPAFGISRNVFFAKKGGGKGVEQPKGAESPDNLVNDFRNSIGSILSGKDGKGKKDEVTERLEIRAKEMQTDLEKYIKNNSAEKTCQNLLGFALRCAEKNPIKNNLGEFIGKNSSKEFAGFVKQIMELLASKEYTQERDEFNKKQEAGSVIASEDGKIAMSLEEARQKLNEKIDDTLKEQIKTELLSYEYAKAYRQKLFEQKFILKQILIKGTENKSGINPNEIGNIKEFLKLLQNEISLQSLGSLEAPQQVEIRDALKSALDYSPDQKDKKDGHEFSKLSGLIEQYKPESILEMENVILAINADEISGDILKEIQKNNFQKRAKGYLKALESLAKKEDAIQKIKDEIAKLEEKNAGVSPKERAVNNKKIEELKSKLEKPEKELFEEYLARGEFAQQELSIRQNGLKEQDISYPQILFEEWEKNQKPKSAADQKKQLDERSNIIKESKKIGEGERKQKYLEAKKQNWLREKARLDTKLTQPDQEVLNEWEREYNPKSYADTIQRQNLENRYEEFNKVAQTKFEMIANEKDIQSGKQIIEKLIPDSSQKTEILDCLGEDPILRKLTVEIFQEFCGILSEDEIKKMTSEETKKKFLASGKMQAMFNAMRARIKEQAKVVHNLEAQIKEKEDLHKKKIGEIDEKIENKKKKLGKAQEELEHGQRQHDFVKMDKIEKEIKELGDKRNKAQDDWEMSERESQLDKVFAEQKQWKEQNGGDNSYKAYTKLSNRIYKKEAEKEKEETNWKSPIRWFSYEEISKGLYNLFDAWKKQRAEGVEYHAGEFSNLFVLNSKQGTLGKQIENKIFNQQKSYWKDELGNYTPAAIEKLFADKDEKLANKACLFVAVGLLVEEANFGNGWSDENIKEIIRTYPKVYPPQVEYEGKMITFEEDPYHYMDKVFGQSGWAAGLERKQATGLRDLFESTHKAFLAKLTAPPGDETQKSICEDIVKYGHQRMNSYQLAGAFKAARDHKQGPFKPIDEIFRVSEVLKNQGDVPGRPVNQRFTHSLCGEDRDRHPLLDYFVVNNSNPEKMNKGFRLLRDNPEEFLRECAIPDAVKRLSSKAASIVDLNKMSSAEGGFDIILLDKGAFEGWIQETNTTNQRVPDDRIKEFLKLTDGGGKKGTMWDFGIDWRNLNIEKHTKYNSFDEMIQDKRRKILTSPKYFHLQEAAEFGYGPDHTPESGTAKKPKKSSESDEEE